MYCTVDIPRSVRGRNHPVHEQPTTEAPSFLSNRCVRTSCRTSRGGFSFNNSDIYSCELSELHQLISVMNISKPKQSLILHMEMLTLAKLHHDQLLLVS